jgi:hypothetical protein
MSLGPAFGKTTGCPEADTDRCPDERFHADEDAVPYVADELSLTTALAIAARAPGEEVLDSGRRHEP